MENITNSTQATQEVGRKFGVALTGGEVILFSGDLGAGKTTFIQGLADGLGIKKRINSPTFIIMREYELENNNSFFHIDLYRLEEVKNIKQELENLGILSLISENKHIFAIEWGERAAECLPKDSIKIDIENVNENTRKIIIER